MRQHCPVRKSRRMRSHLQRESRVCIFVIGCSSVLLVLPFSLPAAPEESLGGPPIQLLRDPAPSSHFGPVPFFVLQNSQKDSSASLPKSQSSA